MFTRGGGLGTPKTDLDFFLWVLVILLQGAEDQGSKTCSCVPVMCTLGTPSLCSLPVGIPFPRLPLYHALLIHQERWLHHYPDLGSLAKREIFPTGVWKGVHVSLL